jgi:hypothetical protein
VFQPGRVSDAFQAASTSGAPLTWTLTGNSVTASGDSTHCQGTITIVKVLNPSTDRGLFNLEIDGKPAGGASAVGDGGTTGTIAVSTGSHTVGESAAPGTSLADYYTQIICRIDGTVVAEGPNATLTLGVKNNQDVVCTITNALKSATKAVVPLLECVVFRSGAPDDAVWSYRNDNDFAVTEPVGSTNGFAPGPADRNQPTTFEPGTWTGIFDTPFSGATSLTWTLGKQTASASAASPRCTAVIELRKVVAPAGDPGVFNLLLNGNVLATGGNGTTTGAYTVGVGEGSVSETAGPGTNLSDYQSKVECTRNGTQEVSVTGTKVDGSVSNGDFVVCTFTNVRITVPPTPEPPEPPLPMPPPLEPPPPAAPDPQPPADLVDLTVTKTAVPTTVLVGQKITWTVKVTNGSTVEASDVNVVKVSERSYLAKVQSVTPSQGTCSSTECELGRIAPGGSATITVVTLATKIGTILNVVRVGSEEQEANYPNNTASNIVRVIGPFRPPPQTAACRTLGAAPRYLRAGATSIVLVEAKNRFGGPVPKVQVHLSGLGLSGRSTTDARGIARFTVAPPHEGFVSFRGSLRGTAAAGPVCATFLAARASSPGSVTG